MSWLIKAFIGAAIAAFASDRIIAALWLALTSGASDGAGSVVRAISTIGASAGVMGQSASGGVSGWGRWLRRKSADVERTVDAVAKRGK